MNALVVIPALIHKYTFSAPLAWLFGHHSDRVKGVYSSDLNRQLVRQYDFFIVELNWFIELYEFGLIVRFIRRHNRKARILFGGMHSQLRYREIFGAFDVDYFIKGDNELPIARLLEGDDPHSIPNMVGRDFENEHSWCFRREDFSGLEFNLDWFPDYALRWSEYPEPEKDIDSKFDRLPLLPRYREKAGCTTPLEYRWRVPPKGGRYHLPMLITGRGACPVVHKGCEYCMGSKTGLMNELYRRPSLVMDNDTLIGLLRKIERKFTQVTLFINSAEQYDLSGLSFNLEATIEYDTFHRAGDVRKVLPAFRSARLHIGLSTEGMVGGTVRDDIASLQELEDATHRVYFFAPPSEAAPRNIPEERRLHDEYIFPPWAYWNFYTDARKAMRRSRQWYLSTDLDNFYLPVQRVVMWIVRFLFRRVLFIAGRAGIIDLRKLMT